MDPGSTVTRLIDRGRGAVIREASTLALAAEGRPRVVAAGEDAEILGERGSPDVRILRPIRRGCVADFDGAVALFRRFLGRATRRRVLLGPKMLAAVPSEASPVERAALEASLRSAGARSVRFLDKILAAALGAGLPIFDDGCHMVVDIGGGTSELGVVAHGRVVASRTLRYGSEDFDEAIRRYVRQQYGLRIEAPMAQRIKLQVGAVEPELARGPVTLEGTDTYGGLFRAEPVVIDGVSQLLAQKLNPILSEMVWLMEELASDARTQAVRAGIVFTGGGALLRGLGTYVSRLTGLPAYVARDPRQAVVVGLGLVLHHLPSLSPDGRRIRPLP